MLCIVRVGEEVPWNNFTHFRRLDSMGGGQKVDGGQVGAV